MFGVMRINSIEEVQVLADELKVSPGIVVGRLHHLGLKDHSWGARLIVRYNW